MAKIACPALRQGKRISYTKEVRTRMHFRPGLFRIGEGSCGKHSSLFLLFEIPFPGKKRFSKLLLAYFKLYPLKKYSIDNFMIYSYIAFENLIKIIFSKKAKGVQYGIREIKGNHCRYFGM